MARIRRKSRVYAAWPKRTQDGISADSPARCGDSQWALAGIFLVPAAAIDEVGCMTAIRDDPEWRLLRIVIAKADNCL